MTKPSEFAKIIEEKQSELTEKTAMISELNKKIDQLREEGQKIRAITGPDELKQVIDSLSGKVDVGADRKTLVFEHELNNVKAFLESNKSQSSAYFFAGRLAWSLELTSCVRENQKYFSIHLWAKNFNPGYWSIRANAGLVILSQSGGLNLQKCFQREFGNRTENHFSWYGWYRFITADNLVDINSGYIKDDKIKIRVHLELGELIRAEKFGD